MLRRLAEELRFSPREAILRHVRLAEGLAADIDEDQSYPLEFVAFRVTAFRGERGEGGSVGGRSLLADLSAMVERWCEAAALTPEELREGEWDDPDALAARWNVARKTIDRWRRSGLVARRLTLPGGGRSLAIMRGVSEAFARRRERELARASAFSRIDAALAGRMVRRAERYQRVFGCSAHAAAGRLAARFGRSPEAVRALLVRSAAERGSLSHRPPIGVPERRVLARAARRGIDPDWLARRTRRTPAGVRRAIAVERMAALRAMIERGELSAPVSPVFSRPDAAEVLLAPEVVRSRLDLAPESDLAGFLAWCRRRAVPVAAEDRVIRGAECFLLHRVRETVAGLRAGNPEATLLDRAETDLRWAWLLRARVARGYWAVALDAAESRIGGPAEALGAVRCAAMLGELGAALRDAADHFDPFRTGDAVPRLAGAVSLAASRRAGRWSLRGEPAARAAAMIPAGVPIVDWTLSIASWAAGVLPPARVLAAARADAGLAVLRDRLGLGVGPPETLGEIAVRTGEGTTTLARRERRELRLALGLPATPARRGG